MPVQAPTRSQPFPRSRPISDEHGDTKDLFLILNPRVPTGGFYILRSNFLNNLFIYQNAYLKFLILCCMFKIDLCSKTLCCIQTCDVFYFVFYNMYNVNTCETFAQKYVFTFNIRNKCMNFMMYQNKMPLRIYLVIGGGLVIGMSRVRIPLQANQERAYLV